MDSGKLNPWTQNFFGGLNQKLAIISMRKILIYVVYHFGGRALRARIVVYNVYQAKSIFTLILKVSEKFMEKCW